MARTAGEKREFEMSWFWLNIPLAAVFVAAWVGIPLWMVLRHPSWSSEPAARYGNPGPEPAMAVIQGRAGTATASQAPGEPGRPEQPIRRRVLAGLDS